MNGVTDLGSISSATLRTEDLLEAFADALENIVRDEQSDEQYGEMMAPVNEARELLDKGPDTWTEEEHEAASWLVNEDLMEALNEHAPDLCYFGAHPGDGADFGYWVSDDAIRDGIHDGDILEVCDARDADRRDIPQYVYHVNDHGNATLYRIQLEEIWSIV